MSTPGIEALGIKEGPNEATGYAFFSTDLDRAFSNAIDNLRAKFPGNINAVVKATGFIAVANIAATYVTVEKI